MTVTYTRQEIKTRLKSYGRWIDYDIEKTVNLIYSIRTCVRKHINDKAINDKLLINNVIIVTNIFGIELSYTILKHICDDDELKFVNTLYYFLSYKDADPKCDYFLQMLYHNCNMYIRN